MVVVDRLSKYSDFMPIKHPFISLTVALTFFDYVFKLHDMPTSIIIDRGSTFLSNFRKELFRLHRASLAYAIAQYSQVMVKLRLLTSV